MLLTQFSADQLRSLIAQSSETSRYLDQAIHTMIAPLIGSNENEIPYYSDPVAGQPYLYRAIYTLFPNLEINVRQKDDGAYMVLAAFGELPVYQNARFASLSQVLADLLVYLIGAAEEEENEELLGDTLTSEAAAMKAAAGVNAGPLAAAS